MRRQTAIKQKFIFEKHRIAMVREDKLSKTADLQQFVLVIEFLLHNSGLRQSCSVPRLLQASIYKSGSPLVAKQGISINTPANGVLSNLVAAFTVFPAGYRNTDGTFDYIGKNGNFWSSTEKSENNAWKRNLNYNNSEVKRNNNNKTSGSSVRCLRDLLKHYFTWRKGLPCAIY